jgi:hypothetical protein
MTSFADTSKAALWISSCSFLVLFKVTTAPWRLHLFSPVVTCPFSVSVPPNICCVCPFFSHSLQTCPTSHTAFQITSILPRTCSWELFRCWQCGDHLLLWYISPARKRTLIFSQMPLVQLRLLLLRASQLLCIRLFKTFT